MVKIEDMTNEEYREYMIKNNIEENWQHRFIRNHPLVWKGEKGLANFILFVIKVKIVLILIYYLGF